jgi:hypothetical protein
VEKIVWKKFVRWTGSGTFGALLERRSGGVEILKGWWLRGEEK